jgi:glycerol uptake facilitator-like aquaporin
VVGAYLAEFTGTFILVLAITATGTSADLAQAVTGSPYGGHSSSNS